MKGGVIKSIRFLFILILIIFCIIAAIIIDIKHQNYSELHKRVRAIELRCP